MASHGVSSPNSFADEDIERLPLADEVLVASSDIDEPDHLGLRSWLDVNDERRQRVEDVIEAEARTAGLFVDLIRALSEALGDVADNTLLRNRSERIQDGCAQARPVEAELQDDLLAPGQ